MAVEEVLEHVNVPSYRIDRSGVIRWVNEAGRRIVGDVRGRQFVSVVAPEETRRARELFARKILGTANVTDAGVVLIDRDGERVGVEVSSVPLYHGAAPHASSGGGAGAPRARPFDNGDRRGAAVE
jgi:PAS domain S-box-containing protein